MGVGGGVVNSPSCIIMHGYVKYPCMGTRGGGGGWNSLEGKEILIFSCTTTTAEGIDTEP